MNKKILSIVGARPQFIKAAVLSEKLKKLGIHEVLVHTGQHYDFNMSDIFFKELFIKKADYNLGVGGGRHGEQTGRMLIKIERVLIEEKPDLVLVFGDTNTTLAGALSSVKLKIPVVHIEAGLRSFNKKMPEEINRIISDHIAELLFAPTDKAIENLKNEGITKNVYKTGDVMFDIALSVIDSVKNKKYEVLKKYSLNDKSFILVTIHRAENTDQTDNLYNIIKAICTLSEMGFQVFFPVHPRTKKVLQNSGFLQKMRKNSVILNEPVSYSEMLILESSARIIITDSGGVQKEAYFFKTPAVIPRYETEWVELVESNWNVLTGPETEKIINTATFLWNENVFNKKWVNYYGNGDASVKIADIIYKTLNS